MQAHLLRYGLVLWSIAIALTAGSLAAAPPSPLQRLEVPFEENLGQFDSRVAFSARTFSGTTFVTRDGRLVHAVHGRGDAGWSVVETLVDANPIPAAGERATTRIARIAADEQRSKRDIPTVRSVSLGEPWPGIAARLEARGANVEKLFTVAPGADATRIRVSVDGAKALRVEADGTLVAETPAGDVRFTSPIAWQDIRGERRFVEARYEALATSYGFRLGDHDPSVAVVIDPLLQSTYLGGSAPFDPVNKMAVDAAGNVYVVGSTSSSDFPGTGGGAITSTFPFGGYVAKLSADLKTLIQATFVQQNAPASATSIAIDAAGNVYIAGNTFSTILPNAAGGAQPAIGSPTSSDGYVMKLAGDLRSVIQSTYIGGTGFDTALAMAFDPAGNVVVGGSTDSPTLPATAGAPQTAPAGMTDAYVTKIAADLRSFVRTTYLGGSASLEQVNALAVDGSGNVFVAGNTGSANFPGTTGGAQPTSPPVASGLTNGFIARLAPDLSALVQSSYVGGNNETQVLAMAIDAGGNPVITGTTQASDLPGTTGGAQPAYGLGTDGFAARFAPDLKSIVQATYLGGNGSEDARAIAIDTDGSIYVSGRTGSASFPGSTGGLSSTLASAPDAYVAKLAPDLKSFTQSTYLGGTGEDYANALLLGNGSIYVAGGTASFDFPGTAGGAQAAMAGVAALADGFIARLSDLRPGPATRFDLSVPATTYRGILFNVTITARDVGGAVASGYTGTVHFTSDDALAILPSDATLTNGVGSFAVRLRTVGSFHVTATDTVNAALTGTSSAITVFPPVAARFRLTAPANATAGTSVDVVVTALDAFDDPTGATIGVRFTSTDANAVLPGMTDLVNGVGTVPVTFKTAGNQTVTATFPSIESVNGTSDPIAVAHGPASMLSVQAPVNAAPDAAFSASVTAFDAFGNIATGYAGTLHFTSDDTGGTLPADAPLTNGQGAFNATLHTPGTRTLTVTDTVAASLTATATVAVSTLGGSASAIDLGGQSMATTSLPQSVTLVNTTGGPLAVTVSISGAQGAQFAQTNDCATLAAGATCTATVTFTPAISQGALNASVPVSALLTFSTGAGDRGVLLTGSAERSLVTHYYGAILGRAPDAQGKAFWLGEATRMQQVGANVNEAWFAMAQSFFFSPEYVGFARNDTDFVTDLYRTFFNRAPDAQGLAFWLAELAAGVPREVLLAQFMFSPEFKAFAEAIFGNTAARAENDMVIDVYRGILKRLPDAQAFAFWQASLRDGQCAPPGHRQGATRDRAINFYRQAITSSEYVDSQRTNAQYVGDLYNAVLRRGGEREGVLFWVGQLQSNAMTRLAVFFGFVTQPEFLARIDAIVAQGCLPP